MNRISLNVVHLNSVPLNLVGQMRIGGSGGEKAPEGYEMFVTADGDFLASDGEFYVKLQTL